MLSCFGFKKRIFKENSPILFKEGRVLAHTIPIPLVPSFALRYYLLHSLILSMKAFNWRYSKRLKLVGIWK